MADDVPVGLAVMFVSLNCVSGWRVDVPIRDTSVLVELRVCEWSCEN